MRAMIDVDERLIAPVALIARLGLLQVVHRLDGLAVFREPGVVRRERLDVAPDPQRLGARLRENERRRDAGRGSGDE